MVKSDSASIMVMPKDEQAFLAAMAVLDSYTVPGDVIYDGVDQKFMFLIEGKQILTDDLRDTLLSPSYVRRLARYFEFDTDKAYSIARNINMHMVDAFGVMLGITPRSHFPDLSKALRYETSDHEWLVVLDTEFIPEEAIPLLEQKTKSIRLLYKEKDLKRIFSEVVKSHWVLGPSSFATYVGVAVGKRVIEIYPTGPYHRDWLSKFGKGYCRMVPQGNSDMLLRILSRL